MVKNLCECSDPGCQACKGSCRCEATLQLFRCDMQDETGVLMCEGCAADALDSGVFSCWDEADDYEPGDGSWCDPERDTDDSGPVVDLDAIDPGPVCGAPILKMPRGWDHI